MNDIITWTLTITNAGVGAAVAPNIFVTDIVESGFINVNATDGSGGDGDDHSQYRDQTPSTGLLHLPCRLAVYGQRRFGRKFEDSITHTNFLDVRGDCGDGCVYELSQATQPMSLCSSVSTKDQRSSPTLSVPLSSSPSPLLCPTSAVRCMRMSC